MKEEYVLFTHVTDGGAIYLTDDHNFAFAKIIIRIDGGAEIVHCEIEEKGEKE